MLRAAMLIVLLSIPATACAGSSRTPRWPKSHVAETDGGESLAPRQASSVAAIDKTADVEVKDDKPAAKTEKAAEVAPTTSPAVTPPAVDDVITTEDIVIEIDE